MLGSDRYACVRGHGSNIAPRSPANERGGQETSAATGCFVPVLAGGCEPRATVWVAFGKTQQGETGTVVIKTASRSSIPGGSAGEAVALMLGVLPTFVRIEQAA